MSAHPTYRHGGPCPLCGASLRPLLTSFYCPMEDRHPGAAQTHGGNDTTTTLLDQVVQQFIISHTHLTPGPVPPPPSSVPAPRPVPAGHVRYDRVSLAVGPSGIGHVALSWRDPAVPGTSNTVLLPVSTTACRQTCGQADHLFQVVKFPNAALTLGPPTTASHWRLWMVYPHSAFSNGHWMATGLQVPDGTGCVETDSWSDVDLPVAP